MITNLDSNIMQVSAKYGQESDSYVFELIFK